MDHLTLQGLWRARLRLLIWTLVGALGATAFTFLHKPTYEVAARLLVEEGPAPLDEREPTLDRNFMPTQAEIASSPAVVAAAAERVFSSEGAAGVEPMPLIKVIAALNVDPLIGANVLSVRFVHENKNVAKGMVEEIINQYRDFLVTDERERNRDSLVALGNLQETLEAREAELLASQTNLRDQTSVIGVGRDGRDLQQDLIADLSQQVSGASARRLRLEGQLKSIDRSMLGQQVSTEPDVQISAAAETRRNSALEVLHRAVAEGWAGAEDPTPVQQALLEAQLRRSELEERVGPKHSAMQAVVRRIETLETKMESLIASVPEMVQRELEHATAQEDQIGEMYREQVERMKSEDNLRIAEQRIIEDLAEVRAEQTNVSAQIVQRRLVNDAETDRPMTILVRTLEAPSFTSVPLLAKRKLVIALGAGFGLLAGLIALAFAPHLRLGTAS